ncbi:MAG TPA: ATP-binding protein [Planktothrix sp.]|jgi:hypothetical protein
MEEKSQAITSKKINADEILPVPAFALQSIDQQISDAGGEWKPPKDAEGSVGRTMFDAPGSEDGSVTVLLPRDHISELPSQTLVRVKSADGRSYIGVVIKGPFAEPDGLKADAPIVVTTTVHGGIFMPKFHGRVQIELMAEEIENGVLVPPRRRPLPNSFVFALDGEETAKVLQADGEVLLGLADGHDDIEVRISSTKKSVLPRHTGILGTTGGGKSTTVSGFLSQVTQAGISSIIIDTEGEYTAINEPTDNPGMARALARRGLTATGIPNTHVLHLVDRGTSNPAHPRKSTFRLDFSELSPYAVQEILELTDAQERRFHQAYDVCKQLLREFGVFPKFRDQAEEDEALEIDELETGYPRMTLSHMLDIVEVFLHFAAQNSGTSRPRSTSSPVGSTGPNLYNSVFKSNTDRVLQKVQATNPDSHDVSWRTLKSKLWRLHRYRVFDNKNADSLNYVEMLQPGKVSIVDLSDTDSPQIRNLVIAQLLKGIQRQQDSNYQAAQKLKKDPTPALIFIEEAHEFLSEHRIKQMPVLFTQVARIARRGRKRWLGLVFITQLPQHLPDEVLALINNWILHKISDSNVVNRLRKSVAGIDSSLWNKLAGLAPGQAIVSFGSLRRPLLVAMDPSPCKLQMVD